MVNYNIIQDFCIQHLPSLKRSPNGWMSFNCPACVHRGETKLDTKKRMGLYLEPTGGVRFHCFRCGFATGWQPGRGLSENLKKLFKWVNVSDNEILELNFQCMKLKVEGVDLNRTISVEESTQRNNVAILPQNTKSFSDMYLEDDVPNKFVTAVQYLISRNENLINWFDDFRWSKNMEDHVIIPIKRYKSVLGWVARLTRPQKNSSEPKYLLGNTDKFLFNMDLLDDQNKKYVIVVEGPLDAIAINGIAIMGNQITEKQIEILNNSNKQIIILPDKDAGGQKLIDCAIKNNWLISLPETQGYNCKDALDLVNCFGRLFALKLIFDAVITNKNIIDIKRKSWK